MPIEKLGSTTPSGGPLPKLEVDKSAGASYLTLQKGEVIRTQALTPDVLVDYGEAGQVIGVELLNTLED